MDPMMPRLEHGTSRRRHRLLFRNQRIPVRMLVPNFFTLLSLCAGLTAIRMAIEGRFDLAVALIVAAALLDGIDGRMARMLKASSRFGAELDSLADFVNFGVAPAVLVYTWALKEKVPGLGWIVAMVFAIACGLRLARFNAMLDTERPKWQSNFFTGMPAPGGAMTVLLPMYVQGLDWVDVRTVPQLIVVHTLLMAFLMVSTIPTYSGKLAGERISREWVLPILAAVALMVALLITYPYGTMTAITVAYLALIPVSWLRFRRQLARETTVAHAGGTPAPVAGESEAGIAAGSGVAVNVVDLRGNDPGRSGRGGT
jgi:CDP-diacylglycerol--serine O-phosphatidyltransferase